MVSLFILCDYNNPVKEGREELKRLKRNAKNKKEIVEINCELRILLAKRQTFNAGMKLKLNF